MENSQKISRLKKDLSNIPGFWTPPKTSSKKNSSPNPYSQKKPSNSNSTVDITVNGNYFKNYVHFTSGISNHSFYVKNGVLFGYGKNKNGQLGVGNKKRTHSPIPIDFFKKRKIIQISCGYEHSIFLESNGDCYSCGSNQFGQLGLTKNNMNTSKSVNMDDRKSIRSTRKGLSVPDSFVFNMISGQNITKKLISNINYPVSNLFNKNTFGTVANAPQTRIINNNNAENRIYESATPRKIGLFGIRAVSCGSFHSIFLSKGGQLFGTGMNETAQLGICNFVNQFHPVSIYMLNTKKIIKISCGYSFSFFLTEENVLFKAGKVCQELVCTMPTKVISLLEPVKNISSGHSHVLIQGLKTNMIYGMGNNNYSALSSEFRPSGVKRFVKLSFVKNSIKDDIVDIKCGMNVSYFLTRYGDFWSVGSELLKFVQGTPKLRTKNIAQIEARGCESVLVFGLNGESYCNGNNENGELGIGNFENSNKRLILLHPKIKNIDVYKQYQQKLQSSSTNNKGFVYKRDSLIDKDNVKDRRKSFNEIYKPLLPKKNVKDVVSNSNEEEPNGDEDHKERNGKTNYLHEVKKRYEKDSFLKNKIFGESKFLGKKNNDIEERKQIKCKLISKIASGAFGSVFKGLDLNTKEIIAVKRIIVTKHFNASKIEKEIEFYSKLKHDHIVKYIGCERKKIEFDDYFFIYFEYCSDGTLNNFFDSMPKDINGKIFFLQIYLEQILKGLNYLHENKIIHRDIKPSNILISKDNKVKLTDFGCAKDIESTQNSKNTIVGTSNYIPPEVLRKDKTIIPEKTDIWSVGILLIRLVCGYIWKKQFSDENQIIFHIGTLKESPEIPEEIKNKDLRFLIRSCLDLDPSKRPSCKELLNFEFFKKKLEYGEDLKFQKDDDIDDDMDELKDGDESFSDVKTYVTKST